MKTLISYKGFSIVARFEVRHNSPYRIQDAHLEIEGYNVTDGGILQVMPGAVWFLTIKEAKEGIDQLLKSGMIHFTISPISTSNPLILQHLREIPIPEDRSYALDVFYSKWNSSNRESMERKNRMKGLKTARCSAIALKTLWEERRGYYHLFHVDRVRLV